jgi:hypothetical protein
MRTKPEATPAKEPDDVLPPKRPPAPAGLHLEQIVATAPPLQVVVATVTKSSQVEPMPANGAVDPSWIPNESPLVVS